MTRYTIYARRSKWRTWMVYQSGVEDRDEAIEQAKSLLDEERFVAVTVRGAPSTEEPLADEETFVYDGMAAGHEEEEFFREGTEVEVRAAA